MKKWNPEYYDKNCIMQFRTAMEMLNALSIHGNENILDIGCGSGKITMELAKRTGGQVVGLDLSSSMVEFASKHYKANNLSFITDDVTKMQLPKKFDVIVSFWTLSWVEDQFQALKNIVNALKDGGKILLMYPMRHDIYDAIDTAIKKPIWIDYFYGFEPRPFVSEARYRTILEKLDLPFSCNKKQIICKFSSYEEMENSIRSWMPHLEKIPGSKDSFRFLADVIEEYFRSKNSLDPVMYFNVLEVVGGN